MLLLVTVTTYVVVALGFAVGLLTVVLLKPVDGLHAYVQPVVDVVPIADPLAFCVQVFVNGLPASAVGGFVFTVTVTLSVAVH